MYACATNEFERSTITDLLFGSVTDVLDRYLPDREKHGALRGMLSLLAVNTTYRGPAVPGTAAALAYGFAVPDENTILVKKLRGGIGALTAHLLSLLEAGGGEVRLRNKVERDPGGRRSRHRGAPRRRLDADRARRNLRCCTRSHCQRDDRPGRGATPKSGSGSRGSTTAAAICRCTSRSTAFRNSPHPTRCSTIQPCSRISASSAPPRSCNSSGRTACAGIVPADPSIALQIPSVNDPGLAPEGKHAASAFTLWFPIGEPRSRRYGEMKAEMGQRVIDKITRLAPNFEEPDQQAHDLHAETHGDDVRRSRWRLLPRPAAFRPDRTQPARPERFCRPTDSDRRSVSRQCGLPRRTRHHLHSRLQRRASGAGRSSLTAICRSRHRGRAQSDDSQHSSR